MDKAGLELEYAENGRIGVELGKSQPFDVILMDIQMPPCGRDLLHGFDCPGMKLG
jgi:CheY-like chemotaxis protein